MFCTSCLSTTPDYSEADYLELKGFRKSLKENPSYAPRVFYAGISVSTFDWKYRSLNGWKNTSSTLGHALHSWFSVPRSRQRILSNPDRSGLKAFISSLTNQIDDDDTLVFYLGTHHLENGDCLLGNKTRVKNSELAEWLSNIPNPILFLADVCYAGSMDTSASWPDNITRLYGSRSGEEAVGYNMNDIRGPLRDAFMWIRLIADKTLGQPIHEGSLLGFQFLSQLASYQQSNDDSLTVKQLCNFLMIRQIALKKTATKDKLPSFNAANLQDTVLLKRDRERKLFHQLKALLVSDADISLEKGLLLVSKIYHPSLKEERYRTLLDTMTSELRPRVEKVTTPLEKINVLTSYLHKEKGLRNVNEPFTEDFLFHKSLDTSKGRCSSFTALYLILGERLGLPLTAGCLPEHIFVQWQTDSTRINIETTENGRIVTDDTYRKMRPWTSTKGSDNFFLKPLNRSQVLATYLSPLGEVMRMRGRFTLAEDILESSISVNPGDAEAWNHLGMLRAAVGTLETARSAYKRALKINPDFAAVWNNLGNISPTLDERLESYRKAVSLNPDLGAAWMNLSYTWFAKRNYQMAWTCANRCLKLGMTLKPGYMETLTKLLEPQNPE